MNISHLFNKTVTTKRLVSTVDSGGSPISTFSENISSLKCRLQQEEGFEDVQGGRQFSEISYVLYCAGDTDLLMKDVVTISSVDYEVVDLKIEGNNDTYLRATLEKAG